MWSPSTLGRRPFSAHRASTPLCALDPEMGSAPDRSPPLGRKGGPVSTATAGALRARAEPAGPGCFVRLQLWWRLMARCCPTRHTLRAARHRSPSAAPDKSLRRSTQQHAASLRRSWSLARARGAGRPVGRRRLTGTSRSCQCHALAPVLQLRQTVYLGAYSRHGKAEVLWHSRT